MSHKESNPSTQDVFFLDIRSACLSKDSPQLMDKIGSNIKHMVEVEYNIVIISNVILRRPHSVVAQSRYKSSSIKPG